MPRTRDALIWNAFPAREATRHLPSLFANHFSDPCTRTRDARTRM